MSNMKFSVAMSVYKNDNPTYFNKAVESILDQTVKPNEIVLVVDGPIPDELNQVVSSYEQNEIFKIFRLEINGGLGNALKICVENSSNELIARMDADDISIHDRFEQQLNCFSQNPTLSIVGGDITEFIGEPENIVGKRSVPRCDMEIKKYMKVRCPFNHVSVMFKKEAVLASGGYLDCFWNEDYYLWIRMMLAGCQFANTGTVLVNVRTGKDMYSRRGGKWYFESELFLQKFMLENKITGLLTFCGNVTKRFIVQRMLPNRIRGVVFRKLARERVRTKKNQ